MKETQTKKFTWKKTIGILVAGVVLTSCALGGTLAKYITEQTATDTARVAKFSVSLGDESETFGLFGNVYNSMEELEAGEKDGNVYNSDEALVAPGTYGYADIGVSNDSEVAVSYNLSFGLEEETAIPLQYSLDGDNWKSDIADLNPTGDLGKDSSVVETLYWRWIFDGDDEVDTELGFEGEETVTIVTKAIFTQID